MLKRLLIRNIAIIQEIEIEWGNGFNVVTGETGAGKSITVEALLLILGERTSPHLIRDGESRGVVEALFELNSAAEIATLLSDRGIEFGGNELIVRREIFSDGKSRAFVNSSQVTVSFLKTLGEFLVDLHGQHEHQSLLKPASQRDFLDIFADHIALRDCVKESYRVLQEKIEAKRLFEVSLSDRERQLDYLRYQEKEISSLNLEDAEEHRLDDESRVLEHSEKIREILERVDQILCESQPSLLELFSKLLLDLNAISELDESLKSDVAGLEDVRCRLEDMQILLRNKFRSLDADPGRLTWIEDRLLEIKRLQKKYGADLTGALRDVRQQIFELEKGAESLEGITLEIEKLQHHYDALAGKLTKQRKAQGQFLSKSVLRELEELGMKGSRFQVFVTETTMGPNGSDDVIFHISTNPGQSPKPLHEIVSGGELSRIMLAIKSLLSRKYFVPILIFDEIDVNLGGDTAHRVAVKLKELSNHHQIIVITHLAQIAAYADDHYYVDKIQSNKSTRTRLRCLAKEERPLEVARMLGGGKSSDAALTHAEELLNIAQIEK